MNVEYEILSKKEKGTIVLRKATGDITLLSLVDTWEEAMNKGLFNSCIAFISDMRGCTIRLNENDFSILKAFIQMHMYFFTKFKIAVVLPKSIRKTKEIDKFSNIPFCIFEDIESAHLWCKS